MSLKSLAAVAALWAGAFSATAVQAAQGASAAICVTPREAEAVVATVAPDLIRLTASMCAPSLPAGAYLRRPVDQLAARYAVNGDGAWPVARAALRKFVPAEMAQMLENDYARPALGSLLAPLLLQGVTSADCASIDRMLTLIDPLPPRNTVALVVTIAELAQRKNPPKSGFLICPPGAAKP